MTARLQRLGSRLRRHSKSIINSIAGPVVVGLLKVTRRMDPDRAAAWAARLMRRVGPFLPEHRVGRTNLIHAYPEKSPAEIEEILRGVWENIGCVAAEYAHLDRLWDFDPSLDKPGRIEITPGTLDRYVRLRDHGKPALIFAAHLGNWELPALMPAANGLQSAVVYRMPNIGNVAAAIREIRSQSMGALIKTGISAPSAVASALERGVHVGMLVDQHIDRGVEVDFFGRRCKANPMIVRIARLHESPIHGARTIRLPGHRFRFELTDPISPPRDRAGRIDVQGTMQVITSIIEGWVREHPEQWLWLHRRWR